MLNPQFPVLLASGQWHLVREADTSILIHILNGARCLQTYRKTGEEAPTTIDEGVEIFLDSRNRAILSTEGTADFYIWPLIDANLRVDDGIIAPTALTQSSFTGDGVLTTTYKDDYITRGNGFQIQRRFTIPASGELILSLGLQQVTNKLVYGLPIRSASAYGLVYLDTYSADSITGEGTLYPSINMNELSTNEALAEIRTGVIPTGVSFLREYIIGTKSTNQSAGGGLITADEPKILINKPLIFHFTNQETDPTVISFGYIWFEL